MNYNKLPKKQCIKCKEIKPICEFHQGSSSCKICHNMYRRGWVVDRNKTPEGKLRNTYKKIYDRCGKYKNYENVECRITIDEFVKLGLQDPNFINLFNIWVEKKYAYAYTPSVDRIDSTKHYEVGNIQFLSHRVNSTKDKKKTTSIYVGINYKIKTDNWTAYVYHQGKRFVIGTFKQELEAAEAVDRKCIELGIPQKNNLIE